MEKPRGDRRKRIGTGNDTDHGKLDLVDWEATDYRCWGVVTLYKL